MNNEQLQDWLTALNERWRSSVEKQALKDVGHEQMLLKLEACNTHYLINYLKCNYADVDLIQPVLGQLLACYCRGGVLRYFTMQCIPSLIHLYLLALAKRQKKSISMFEILFLAIYNEEILVAGTSSGSGMKKVDKIRIPSTRFPSVYHDPRKLNILSDVSFKSGSTSFVEMTVRIGPYKSADKITPENRQTILTRLLKSVNSCLCRLSHDVICKYICSTTISVCQSGFHFSETSLKSRVCDEDLCSEELDEFSMKPRLQSSAQYLLESLNGLYFALFNGESQLAIQAIDAVHQRALYEFYSDVILVTNSIKDTLLESSFQSNERLLKCNRSNHGKVDGRRGSELITNSSLRLKKMPEDISPVVDDSSKECIFSDGVENLKKRIVTKMEQHKFSHFGHLKRKNEGERVKGIELDAVNVELSSNVTLNFVRCETEEKCSCLHPSRRLSVSDAPINTVSNVSALVSHYQIQHGFTSKSIGELTDFSVPVINDFVESVKTLPPQASIKD